MVGVVLSKLVENVYYSVNGGNEGLQITISDLLLYNWMARLLKKRGVYTE